jgi:hypothetical protein
MPLLQRCIVAPRDGSTGSLTSTVENSQYEVTGADALIVG